MKKYVKQITSLFMAITMLFSITAATDFSACAAVYGEDIVEYARQFIGCNYEYGQAGPNSFDCSGFVRYVFKHFGISLPHSSSSYWNNSKDYGTVVGENSISNAEPGDVISWNGHVGIYTGNGYIVEAANSRVGVAERKYDFYKYNGNYRVIRIYGVQSASHIDGLPFRDLGRYTSYIDYVRYTSQYNSYIAGTNPPYYTEFSPTVSITRGMLVAILYRMAGNPYDKNNPYSDNPFSDINTNAYYYNAACWALDEGITNQTDFKPNNNVTREQTARFLYAYAQSKNMLGSEAYKDVELADYPDYDSVSEWALEPLKWANYNNMITGTQQGYVNPQGATQRIHATRILYGFGKACNIGNFK